MSEDTQEDEYPDTLNGMLRFMQDKGDVAIEEVIDSIEDECGEGNVSVGTLRQFAAELEGLADTHDAFEEFIEKRASLTA